MPLWLVIALLTPVVIVLAAHVAGVAFVLVRIALSHRASQKQFSPR